MRFPNSLYYSDIGLSPATGRRRDAGGSRPMAELARLVPVIAAMVNGTLESGGALRRRLQLSLGGVAELRDEVAGVAGRRRFAAVARDGGHPVIVTLHQPAPTGPDPAALMCRLDALRALSHGTLDLPLAHGELDGCAWVADAAPLVPAAANRLLAGPLPLAQAVSAIRELTRALAAMHRRGITHGAIDLDVVGVGNDGARLGGLGLSLGGSPRDDLDALGHVAWSLLNGERRPTSVRPLSQLRRGVSPELDALCASLLASDPADRPQRAEAILDALDAIPTRRRHSPTSIVDRGGHDVRSRPQQALGWLVISGAILLLVGLLTSGV